MGIRRLGLGGLALAFAVGFWACGGDDTTGTGNTAGSSGSTGGNGGTNGTSGSGGSTAGTQSGSGGSGGSSAGGGGSSAAGSGGGSNDASTTGDALPSLDAKTGGDGGAFSLTSTAYTEGMMIPAVHTCAGAGTSPALAWSGAPAATKSFALVFTDKDNGGAAGFVHWVLWDIPPATMSLPAMLAAGMPAGSKGSSIGANGAYAGPCPSGNLHHYIFELYPLDVDTLPGVTTNTMRPALVTAIKMHQIVAPASLSGTSDARRP